MVVIVVVTPGWLSATAPVKAMPSEINPAATLLTTAVPGAGRPAFVEGAPSTVVGSTTLDTLKLPFNCTLLPMALFTCDPPVPTPVPMSPPLMASRPLPSGPVSTGSTDGTAPTATLLAAM